jgi:hypothetical protein
MWNVTALEVGTLGLASRSAAHNGRAIIGMESYLWSLVFASAWGGAWFAVMRSFKSDDAITPWVLRNAKMNIGQVQRGTPVSGLVLEWVEPQPSWSTFKAEYDRVRGRKAFIYFALCMTVPSLTFLVKATLDWGWSSERLMSTAMLGPLWGIFLFGICALFFEGGTRQDDEPIPILVQRTAAIELVDNSYYFVVMSRSNELDNNVEVYKPWSDVNQFSKADYWRTFGDAGKSIVSGGWAAVIMAPASGPAWLISSTLEGDSAVYERVTALNALFSDAARLSFERGLTAPVGQFSTSNSPTLSAAASQEPVHGGDVPNML